MRDVRNDHAGLFLGVAKAYGDGTDTTTADETLSCNFATEAKHIFIGATEHAGERWLELGIAYADPLHKSSTSLMPRGLMDRYTKEEILELLSFIVAERKE